VRRGRAKLDAEGRNWSGGGLVDAFDAKRDALTLLSALGAKPNAVQVVPGGPSFLTRSNDFNGLTLPLMRSRRAGLTSG
jgi:hypothetical protein